MIEIGPGSGGAGGSILTQGTIAEIAEHSSSLIGEFLDWPRNRHLTRAVLTNPRCSRTVRSGCRRPDPHRPRARRCFPHRPAHRSHRHVRIWQDHARPGQLVPALAATSTASRCLRTISLDTPGVTRADVVDAPRSAPTSVDRRDLQRRPRPPSPSVRRHRCGEGRALNAGDFSYNTGSLRCPRCEGTGQVVLDVQFLPTSIFPVPIAANPATPRPPPRSASPLPGDRSLPELLGTTVVNPPICSRR